METITTTFLSFHLIDYGGFESETKILQQNEMVNWFQFRFGVNNTVLQGTYSLYHYQGEWIKVPMNELLLLWQNQTVKKTKYESNKLKLGHKVFPFFYCFSIFLTSIGTSSPGGSTKYVDTIKITRWINYETDFHFHTIHKPTGKTELNSKLNQKTSISHKENLLFSGHV